MSNHKVGDLVYSGSHLGIIRKAPTKAEIIDDLLYHVEWCYEPSNPERLPSICKYGPLTIQIMVEQLQDYMIRCERRYR